jgi:hypothetical protein
MTLPLVATRYYAWIPCEKLQIFILEIPGSLN